MGIQERTGLAPNITSVTWSPPPLGWIKVNMTGSAKEVSSVSGCNGVFCTSHGFVKGCFAFLARDSFAFEVEILAFIFAIEKAAQFNWNKLWIECDSTYVTHAFYNQSVSIPWKIQNHWLKALVLSKKLQILLTHVFRKGNTVANKLVASGSSLLIIFRLFLHRHPSLSLLLRT